MYPQKPASYYVGTQRCSCVYGVLTHHSCFSPLMKADVWLNYFCFKCERMDHDVQYVIVPVNSSALVCAERTRTILLFIYPAVFQIKQQTGSKFSYRPAKSLNLIQFCQPATVLKSKSFCLVSRDNTYSCLPSVFENIHYMLKI